MAASLTHISAKPKLVPVLLVKRYAKRRSSSTVGNADAAVLTCANLTAMRLALAQRLFLRLGRALASN